MAGYYHVVEVILRNVSDDFMRKFSSLKSNRERFALLSSDAWVVSLLAELMENTNEISKHGKCDRAAKAHRDRGNELFRAGNLKEALKNYNECVISAQTRWKHEGTSTPPPNLSGMLKDCLTLTRGQPASELSLALANRSAVMLKLSRYEDCIDDAIDSIRHGYPAGQAYKLLSRMSVCYEHVGRFSEAKECYDLAGEILECSDLTPAECESQKRIISAGAARCRERLKDTQSSSTSVDDSTSRNKEKEAKEHRGSNRVKGDNSKSDVDGIKSSIDKLRIDNPLPQPSTDAVEFVYSPDFGKHVRSTRDIGTGEVIVTDATFAKVLDSSHLSDRCHCCFGAVLSSSDRLFPCATCRLVRYCSKECSRLSGRFDHRHFECQLLSRWLCSGTGLLAWIVVRILISVGVEGWKEIVETKNGVNFGKNAFGGRDSTVTSENDVGLSGVDFDGAEEDGGLGDLIRREVTRTAPLLYNLLSHSEKRPAQELLQYSILALWIVLLLRKSGMFDNNKNNNNDDEEIVGDKNLDRQKVQSDVKVTFPGGDSTTEAFVTLGGIALEFLQIVSCNGIEMTTMVPSATLAKCEPKSYGLALYPKASLFNHSCDPDVEFLFKKDTLVARCLRPIKAGRPISIDYGYLFYSTSRDRRRSDLMRQYYFACFCDACSGNWPLKKDLEKDAGGFVPGNARHAAGESKIFFDCPVCGNKRCMFAIREKNDIANGIEEGRLEYQDVKDVPKISNQKKKKKKNKQVTKEVDPKVEMQNSTKPLDLIGSNQRCELFECLACGTRADKGSIDRLRSMNYKLDDVLQDAGNLKITSKVIKCLELYQDCRYHSPPKKVTREMVNCISTLKQCYRLFGNE